MNDPFREPGLINKLYRNPRRGMIFGVCAGLAEYFGFDVTVTRVIVAVGGKESFWGAALGSFFLTVVPQYLRSYEQIAMLLYGLILIAVFMYLPGGLVSLVRWAFGTAR